MNKGFRKKQYRTILSLLAGILISGMAVAQEQLVPLSYNPAYKQSGQSPVKNNAKGGQTAVKLPFIDDFSRPGIYPYADHWQDRYVFVNRSYAVNPPSIGVATFDAINDTGAVYSHMSAFAEGADTLTSVDIRLDSLFTTNKRLTPADSVYMSFWIQPQGMGDDPQEEDSIVLQFYTPSTGTWKSVWHMKGMPLDSLKAKYGTDFLQVLIPITDTAYFKPDFKFRFYNYASIPGNNIPSWRSGVYDHWNLDYVYIDAGRNYKDYYYEDVAFNTEVSSLLKEYQSMPWKQFKANANAEMNHSANIRYYKLSGPTSSRLVTQFFTIKNLHSGAEFHPPVNPSSVNMTVDSLRFHPDYSAYTFNSSATPYADFQVIFSIVASPDFNTHNDTLKFFQRFYNYFAYDDGIPEAGYGLSTPNGRLAIQFKVNTPDSIQSVQFYFNQTLGASNQQYFDLSIWADNNGTPGNLLYQQQNMRPEFENKLFKFYTYKLNHAVAVSGTFYVGWRQSTSDNLNVGWDRNNNKQDKVFYNVAGAWYNTSYHGVPMIRPILGLDDEAYLGVETAQKDEEVKLLIAPNPVTSAYLSIIVDKESIRPQDGYQIRIYDLRGSLVRSLAYQKQVNVEGLPNGIYLLQLRDQYGRSLSTQKFIITKQ